MRGGVAVGNTPVIFAFATKERNAGAASAAAVMLSLVAEMPGAMEEEVVTAAAGALAADLAADGSSSVISLMASRPWPLPTRLAATSLALLIAFTGACAMALWVSESAGPGPVGAAGFGESGFA